MSASPTVGSFVNKDAVLIRLGDRVKRRTDGKVGRVEAIGRSGVADLRMPDGSIDFLSLDVVERLLPDEGEPNAPTYDDYKVSHTISAAAPDVPMEGEIPIGPKNADPVNHPRHYTSHPSGVECITVVEHMGFNVGNAIKYLWRADLKGNALEDLKKAAWYVQREIERRTKAGGAT